MTVRSVTRRSARGIIAALAATASVAAASPPALSSAPQHIAVDESESFRFPLCGIDTLVEGTEVGTLMIRDRGPAGIDYYLERVARQVTNTNLTTGRSVLITQDYRGRDQRIVDNGDGTLTILFRVTFNQTDYAPDGSVAFRTSGQDTVRVVVDHNGTPGSSDDDTVLSEDYLGFTGHDGRAGTDFCEWYAAVTS
jgi:hypothetical protein